MIIYLHGPDSYRRTERLKELLALYKKKHPLHELGRFSLEDQNDIARFRTFLESQSLFTADKLAIVEAIEVEDRALPELIGNAFENREVTIIISLLKKLTKSFAAIEKKSARTESFELLRGQECLTFLEGEMAKRKLALNAGEMQALSSKFEGDTWGLVTALDVLELGGAIVEPSLAPAFFPALQRLKQGSLRERIPLLTMLLEREEPAAIFNILASLTSGPQKIKMADYDVAIKSGKLEYEEALTDLVISN